MSDHHRKAKPRLKGETRLRIRDYLAGRDGRRCSYCGEPFAEDLSDATLDHFIPYCLWPMNRPRNLVLACEPCNNAKGDALPWTLVWLLLATVRGTVPATFVNTHQAAVNTFTADWSGRRPALTGPPTQTRPIVPNAQVDPRLNTPTSRVNTPVNTMNRQVCTLNQHTPDPGRPGRVDQPPVNTGPAAVNTHRTAVNNTPATVNTADGTVNAPAGSGVHPGPLVELNDTERARCGWAVVA